MVSAPPERSVRFRPDIEGLRAVAVLMVLGYHAGVPGFGGGFAGVDVFFVISGFLITGLLVAEVERSGRIDLRRFWARRARRLLPAAVTVLVITALLTWWLIPQSRWRDIGGDVVASALYVVNWRLADRSVDYLAEDVAASPVQHYWSLAVEEQFYVLWPLLMLLGVVLWRRRLATRPQVRRHRTPPGPRPFLAAVLAGLVLVSLGWSLVRTTGVPEVAFFDTGTRLWELGLGGLVAVGAPLLLELPRRVRLALGWAGLGAVVVSLVAIDTGTAWPGYAALLPTLGTAAVIAGGLGPLESGPERVLGVRPMLVVGGLSYSLYLWHWPPLVAAEGAGGELTPWAGVGIVLLSAVPAWLSFRYLETPIRHARSLAVPVRALAMGLTTALVAVLAGVGLVRGFDTAVERAEASPGQGAAALGDGAEMTADLEATTATATPDEAELTERPTPAVLAGHGAATAQVVAASRHTVIAPPDTEGLDLEANPEAITPDPMVAPDDLPQVYADDCDGKSAGQVVRCDYGDPDGDLTVALVGDSKVAQWADALDEIGQERGWQVRTYYWSACAWVDATILRPDGEPDMACRAWGEDMTEVLTGDDRPDVVLVSSVKSTAVPPGGGDETREGLVDGYVERWSLLDEAGVQVVAIADTVQPGVNLPECVAESRDDVAACAFPRNEGSGTQALVAAVARAENATMVDMNDWVCPAEQCPPVIGEVMVYRQGSHITNTYAVSLVEPLEARLVAAFEGLGVTG